MKPTILIGGGGTGGHVFPGLAVASALRALGDVNIVFCGTARGLESRAIPKRGYVLETLDVEPIQGGGLGRAARGSAVAMRATVCALQTIRRVQPHVVLGVGGYASGPVALAAAMSGIPLALLEPNSAVGLANRIVGPFASRAYVAWESGSKAFRRRAVRKFGVPVQDGFSAQAYVSRGTSRVLVMGGSQGSAALNERMPRAIAQIAALVPAVQVLHQAGRDRDASVRAAYANEQVTGAVVVPFIDDVAVAIADADVVVARAGAVTLAELTAIGRAAVLVPFPHATDDHQAKNADELARVGAAVSLRQAVAEPASLANEVGRLLRDDAARTAMATASRHCGRPSAARDVAADLLDLVMRRRAG